MLTDVSRLDKPNFIKSQRKAPEAKGESGVKEPSFKGSSFESGGEQASEKDEDFNVPDSDAFTDQESYAATGHSTF